jgi:serine/threonine protein kinase
LDEPSDFARDKDLMAVQNSSVLQRSALLSGLLTRDQLDEALAKAKQPEFGDPAPRVEVTDEQLARQLIELELLTPYQAEQLKAGRTKLTLGPYTITDWIAQGGMGQVFKAEHQMMGREVAIKVLPHSRSTPQAIDNFMREIRAQAVLDHDNLVRAFDAGHDGNVYYLVTEFVRGTDLRRFVRSQGPLSVPHAASIVLQAAHGLASAHEQGLIHRDIKPGNILVTPDGKAKVSDLGLAGFLQSNEYDPRSHKIVGTADYISPEQIKSPESVTPTSDIYSLGCTLYYTVTGKVPFPGGTTRDKARRHCEETPWHPRRFNPDVNEDFVDIIADMMEKDPSKRIPSAEEVVTRLEPWAPEALRLPAQQPTSSPWMAPPLPAHDDEDEELAATQYGSYDESDSHSTSGVSNSSQTTDPQGSQETRTGRHRIAPSLPMPPPAADSTSNHLQTVLLTLAVAVPISAVIGALLTLVLQSLLK